MWLFVYRDGHTTDRSEIWHLSYQNSPIKSGDFSSLDVTVPVQVIQTLALTGPG
jgi:hypothetical protein